MAALAEDPGLSIHAATQELVILVPRGFKASCGHSRHCVHVGPRHVQAKIPLHIRINPLKIFRVKSGIHLYLKIWGDTEASVSSRPASATWDPAIKTNKDEKDIIRVLRTVLSYVQMIATKVSLLVVYKSEDSFACPVRALRHCACSVLWSFGLHLF